MRGATRASRDSPLTVTVKAISVTTGFLESFPKCFRDEVGAYLLAVAPRCMKVLEWIGSINGKLSGFLELS